jgi:hypothetical protein
LEVVGGDADLDGLGQTHSQTREPEPLASGGAAVGADAGTGSEAVGSRGHRLSFDLVELVEASPGLPALDPDPHGITWILN